MWAKRGANRQRPRLAAVCHGTPARIQRKHVRSIAASAALIIAGGLDEPPAPSAEPASKPRQAAPRRAATPPVEMPEIAREPTHADNILAAILDKLGTDGVDLPNGHRAVPLPIVREAVGMDTVPTCPQSPLPGPWR
jgi:hypothetical protein